MNVGAAAADSRRCCTPPGPPRTVETELSAIGLSLAKQAALKVLSDAGESLPLTQLAERLSCVKSTSRSSSSIGSGRSGAAAGRSQRSARASGDLDGIRTQGVSRRSRVQDAAERHLLATQHRRIPAAGWLLSDWGQ
jgi:hypothetical protein